jgi:hypothetical protein
VLAALLAAALLLLAAAAVAAPAPGGGEGLFDVQSARVPPAGSYAVSVTGAAYQVERRREPGSVGDRVVTDGGMQLTVGLGGRLELWARYGAALVSYADDTALSYRDGLVGAKVGLWRAPWLAAAVSGGVTVPWGNRPRGFSSDSWDPSGALLLTFPLPDSNAKSAALLHLNLGYSSRGDDRGRTYDGFPLYYLEPVYPGGDGDRIDLRGAVELRSRRISVFAEAVLDRMVSDDVSAVEGPIWVTPGFRLALTGRVSLLVASKIAISADDPATAAFRPPEEMFPDWQIGFALTWSNRGEDPDRDGDGVPDFRDRCLTQPEDRDDVADADGCPETDADGDGIPDEADACPELAEDLDGDADEDGCPEEAPVVEEAPAVDDAPADPSPADPAPPGDQIPADPAPLPDRG